MFSYVFQVDGNELNATAKLFQVVAIYSNFAGTLRNRPTWDPPKMEEGFLMEPLCFREISGWWKMIHLDSSWVVFEEGMVFFFLVKMIALVFDRQPPGNDHNPPPTSHVEVSENHRLKNAGRNGIC